MNPGWHPLDDRESEAQIRGVMNLISPPPRRLVDLGCGDGRTLVPLAQAGHHLIGVDSDPAAVARSQSRVREARVEDRARIIEGDFLLPEMWFDDTPADAVLLLGNTLATLLDHDRLRLLFRIASRLLRRGGAFVIDDLPFTMWREVAEGNWQEGVSEDGSMQIVWKPGEPIFALRQGQDEVDESDWTIRPDDAQYRIWSLSDLNDAARPAGLSAGGHEVEHGLLSFRRD